MKYRVIHVTGGVRNTISGVQSFIKNHIKTEDEEFEISKKVPFIKKLLDLKMRNFGSELVKEIFGDNVKLDLTEEGMVIVPETGKNEIPN